MRNLLHTLAIAALALALPLAALAQNNLNLDTGTAVSSGGDIAFSSTGIAPVGSAQLADLTTLIGAEFGILSAQGSIFEGLLAGESYATTPIPSSKLVSNEAIAVHTNGGNYAALLVTAASSGSITLQYLTYNTTGTKIQGATVTLGGPAAPSITQVQNNYSFILPGAPNYGIAPGALILISGNAMATPGSQAVLPNLPATLPTTLNGSTVSITVNGTTVNPAFYYAIPSYLGVVVPSNTPVGTGTITVSYGGQTSTPVPIKIVAHAFGFDYYGGALAGITDNIQNSPRPGHLITSSHSAQLGEIVTFWGSGDGANTKNDDVNPPTNFDQVNGITAFYIGGVQAQIGYQGRSGYQGVDQINVTIPPNAPTGCAVSVVAVSGTGASAIVSNFVSMPIATTDGQCIDPLTFVDPTEATTLSGKTTVKFGGISVDQSTTYSGATPTVAQEAGAFFYSISGSALTGYTSSSQPSLGSCFVTQYNSSVPVNPYTLTGLNAGTISVTGPNGTVQLKTFPQVPGIYIASSPPDGTFTIPTGGGLFTFNGTGGTDVGAFTADVNFLNPLVWTNSSSDGTVTRTQGVTVTWTGGAPGTFVQIGGDSASAGFSASFVCDAPVSAGSFTVPVAVLLALPAGNGGLTVSNYTNPASVTIPGVDFGYAMAYVSTSISATYN